MGSRVFVHGLASEAGSPLNFRCGEAWRDSGGAHRIGRLYQVDDTPSQNCCPFPPCDVRMQPSRSEGNESCSTNRGINLLLRVTFQSHLQVVKAQEDGRLGVRVTGVKGQARANVGPRLREFEVFCSWTP